MKYKDKDTISIPLIWQLLGVSGDAVGCFLLFIGFRALLTWMTSAINETIFIWQLALVIGILAVAIGALFCVIAAGVLLVELFNGGTDFKWDKKLVPSKTFIITEDDGKLSLYFKKWWGTYYQWQHKIETKDPAQLSYDYKQFLIHRTDKEKKKKLNIVFEGRAK